MRFAVIGAGGIGCYYGAKLVEAKQDVIFVARGKHLSAMQAEGLTVHHPDFVFQEKVTATSLETFVQQYQASEIDVLLICLKSTATEEVANTLKSWINKSERFPYVMSLQNGMGNETILCELLGQDRIIGAFAVRIGADVTNAGLVDAVGVAQVVMGEWPKQAEANEACSQYVSELVELFNQAEISTRHAVDIRKELWRKLVINNGLNPLATLVQKDTKFLTHHDEYAILIKKIMYETAIASHADGSNLNNNDVEEMFQLIYEFDAIKPSMLIDREKGRVLELEHICVPVIEGCKIAGKEAPYTHTIYTLLKNMEI